MFLRIRSPTVKQICKYYDFCLSLIIWLLVSLGRQLEFDININQIRLWTCISLAASVFNVVGKTRRSNQFEDNTAMLML